MFNFFFTSFGKAYVTHLDKPENKSHIDILCINSTAHFTLMEWDTNTYFSTIDSKNSDIKNAILSEIKQINDTVELWFIDGKSSKTSEFINNTPFDIQKKKKSVSLSCHAIDTNTVNVLHIKVRLEEYESTVTFHCIPEDNLYDIVLDFGSEASQMLISKHNPNSAITPEKVFANTLSHFYNIQKVKGNRVYDQQDEDEKLFRSIFYLKKNSSMSESFEYEKPSRDDTFFSFMSKRTESHEGRIPNIKIAYLTGTIINGASDMQTLHRGIVSRFLHEAVYRISELHKNRNEKVGINFTVLLPNVMPQNAVSSFLSNMRRVANSKEFIQSNGSQLQIEYINVNSCSESDASFLECLHQAALPGIKNKIKVDPGKRYLIIDIGKGTTDFSIVKLSSATSAISEYRAGFVGAGNAISYAIFLNYMKSIAGKKAHLLADKMLNSEPAILFELENKIEDSKRNWSMGKKAETVETITKIDNITPEAVLDKIEELGFIDDSQGEVSKMLDKISDRIIDQIPLEKIDYVIFSGRSFKFEKLKTQLETYLNNKSKKNLEVFFNPETAKNGCLFGPLRNISLSLKSQMVGFPIIVDTTKIRKSNTNDKEQHETTTAPIINAETLKLQRISTTIQKIAKGAKKIFELFGDDEQSNAVNALKSASTNFDSEIKVYMTTGKEIHNMDENCCIIISGNIYATGDQYTVKDDDKPYFLYFDGEDYYLKHNNGCHKLIMQVNRGSQHLLKESQFPYSLLLNL